MNDLEARIRWLESVIQKHLPSFDLSARPGPLNKSAGVSNEVETLELPGQMHNNQNIESLDTITEGIGLISVTKGADLRYLGPSSG